MEVVWSCLTRASQMIEAPISFNSDQTQTTMSNLPDSLLGLSETLRERMVTNPIDNLQILESTQ